MSAPAVLSIDPRADWMHDAHTAIDALVVRYHRTGQTFTAEDLRRMVGEPEHCNWIGTAFRAACKRGAITQEGYTLSHTKSRRGGVIRVWKAATP